VAALAFGLLNDHAMSILDDDIADSG